MIYPWYKIIFNKKISIATFFIVKLNFHKINHEASLTTIKELDTKYDEVILLTEEVKLFYQY